MRLVKRDYCYVMTLTTPVEVPGGTLDTIVLRDLDAVAVEDVRFAIDARGIDVRVMGEMPRLIALATGLPPEVVRNIRLGDIAEHLVPMLEFFGFEVRISPHPSAERMVRRRPPRPLWREKE